MSRATVLPQQRMPSELYAGLVRLPHVRPSHRRWAQRRQDVAARRAQVDNAVVAVLGTDVVGSGALSGLRLHRESAWGLDYSARLLRTYEQELHEAISRLVDTSTAHVLDVGCADGYDAVGLALRAPSAVVDAFDVDPAALAVTRALAALNGVENRVGLHAKCQPSDLSSLAPNTVVVMDCEGAEAHLLTDDVARSNADAAFVVDATTASCRGSTGSSLNGFGIGMSRGFRRPSGSRPMRHSSIRLSPPSRWTSTVIRATAGSSSSGTCSGCPPGGGTSPRSPPSR